MPQTQNDLRRKAIEAREREIARLQDKIAAEPGSSRARVWKMDIQNKLSEIDRIRENISHTAEAPR